MEPERSSTSKISAGLRARSKSCRAHSPLGREESDPLLPPVPPLPTTRLLPAVPGAAPLLVPLAEAPEPFEPLPFAPEPLAPEPSTPLPGPVDEQARASGRSRSAATQVRFMTC